MSDMKMNYESSTVLPIMIQLISLSKMIIKNEYNYEETCSFKIINDVLDFEFKGEKEFLDLIYHLVDILIRASFEKTELERNE